MDVWRAVAAAAVARGWGWCRTRPCVLRKSARHSDLAEDGLPRCRANTTMRWRKTSLLQELFLSFFHVYFLQFLLFFLTLFLRTPRFITGNGIFLVSDPDMYSFYLFICSYPIKHNTNGDINPTWCQLPTILPKTHGHSEVCQRSFFITTICFS